MTEWSPDQSTALDAVGDWLKDTDADQVFRLFGYAGTGKTTLAKHLADQEDGKVLFGAFTGKAAMVMRQKGCGDASTIHSMIYKPKEKNGIIRFKLDKNSPVKDADLVIIDECSMVGNELAEDLLSFGTKVLALGDPAQLPPVKDAGYFTNEQPDVMLIEIHRQARGNPIIHMATKVRRGQHLNTGEFEGCKVIDENDFDEAELLETDQVICGMNKTRQRLNSELRAANGFKSLHPEKNDRLVCLRNNHAKGLLNGSIWSVEDSNTSPQDDFIHMLASSEDFDDDVKRGIQVLPEFFEGKEKDLDYETRRHSDEFTFGYALTAHKSQGSQWDDVVVLDEGSVFREDQHRWLYTAITRAAKRITVVQ